ncbi:TPA: hypothetical protein ACH3X3_013742 [Trebouxia sp. C0006]
MRTAESTQVVIQTSHQSQCPRFVLFLQDTSLRACPPKLAQEAVELGPRSNKAGPCLVLLKGVSATQAEFFAWFSTSYLRRYCPRVYWLGSCGSSVTDKEELLHSICTAGSPGGSIRLQCCPRSLEKWLAAHLPETFKLDPKVFHYVLNVVATEGKLLWNLHETDGTYRQTTLLTESPQKCVSSAVHKLEEALHLVGHHLGSNQRAIDLGAAPGGWSFYLAKHMAMVIAVDPANLSPELSLPNVHHLRCKSELAGDTIETLLEGEKADLLVADMNQHPDTTVQAMKPLLPFVKAGGTIIMTMKFYGLGRDRSAPESRVLEAFGCSVEPGSGKAVWLMANTVNERTFIAVRSQTVI